MTGIAKNYHVWFDPERGFHRALEYGDQDTQRLDWVDGPFVEPEAHAKAIEWDNKREREEQKGEQGEWIRGELRGRG